MKKTIQQMLLLACAVVLFAACGGSGSTPTNDKKDSNGDKQCASAKHSFVKDGNRHWVWIGPDPKEDEAVLAQRYKEYFDAGIRGIFFEADVEKHFRVAKAQGLETHLWFWIMNRGDFLETHPEYYAVSRDGKSCATHPPYVGYYRWMCPSRPEVADHLAKRVDESLKKDYIDGIHMDYVRYSDVILAVNLWDTYKITQREEQAEYDFCYCDLCKSKFKEQYGRDISAVAFPEEDLSWKRFRYDGVSNIVSKIADVAKANNKPLTAAVFPTPEVALRKVRQDWTAWDLDAVFPMIYHGFYKEEVLWIGTAVNECLLGIHGRYPIYAGLYLPDFKNNDEIRLGVETAMKSGAAGVSIFGRVTPEVLQILKDNK